jgi:DNA-binding NtrC family response regulator
MPLFKAAEWTFSENALELATTNPFHPDWRQREAELLGEPVRDVPPVIAWQPPAISWSPGAQLWGPQSVYSEKFDERVTEVVERLHPLLQGGAPASVEELDRYELLSVYRLYCLHGREMDEWIAAAVRGGGRPAPWKALWSAFRHEYGRLLEFAGRSFPRKYEPEHLFACFFLFRRAFYHIFFNIVGTSRPIARLRSSVWESIVTHDLLGWMQGLHDRMKDIPTLITGPSGTGKERVAEAIGRSPYIPFDPKKGFETHFLKAFNPVNLSALSPLLIESELFGHVKGAFSGAVRDRIGRLEECPECGAVFLDEIGELTKEIQVKLLRVLQTRRFQRVGENEDRVFRGKVIAATNRDLAAEMQAGRFREDFYYRLCADQITTPSLREQLEDRPEDLPLMMKFVCRSVVGENKADELAGEVVDWIERHLPHHAWPGNFRELEQCVRSYTIRREYQPPRPGRPRADEGPPRLPCDPVEDACAPLAAAVLKVGADCPEEKTLKEKRLFDRIKRRLFTLVRAGTDTKQEAAAHLGIDVRTLDAGMKAPGNEGNEPS